MNLILKFPGEQQRAAFAEKLGVARPDVASHFHPAKSRPHAVLEDLTEEQVSWVRDSISGLGHVFEDFPFQPFPPAGKLF